MKDNRLNQVQDQLKKAIANTNVQIETFGEVNSYLYDAINNLQQQFDKIRNVPSEQMEEYKKAKKITTDWNREVEKLKSDYKSAVGKRAGTVAAGAGAGTAVATLAPTAAMGIATTFGVASTGTAISSLSGAAASNAALAWLGGGALSAGGGGIAAGQALLALAGPVGWIISGTVAFTSGFLLVKDLLERKQLENMFIEMSNRDMHRYDLAQVELSERISRAKDETDKLTVAVRDISEYGLDYSIMTEQQQYALGSYVNLLNASAQLLVNPIEGLQPRVTEKDYVAFLSSIDRKADMGICEDNKDVILSLANWLYGIELDEKEKKIVCNYIKNNKDMLKVFKMEKKAFDVEILYAVLELSSR